MKAHKALQQLPEVARLFQAGRLAEARTLGRSVLAAAPKQVQLLSLLGTIHARLGEFPEAEACYRTLVSAQPGDASHYQYLGLTLVMQQRHAEAVPVFARMLQLRPAFAEGHMQMGCLLRDLGHHERAIHHFERALQLAPGLADAAVFLGNMRVFQGRMDDALQCYEQALAHRPGHPDAIAGKALILERCGDKEAAWALLQPLVAQNAATPNLAISFALLAPKFAATAQAKTLLQNLLARGGLAPSQQQELHFALGKLCDKAADYDAAFQHYAAGNRLTQIVYDISDLRAKVVRIERVFARPDMPSVAHGMCAGPMPVFIVGMPRSGTSLVEQILASHPDVAAGGELECLPDIERAACETVGRGETYPECLLSASAEDMAELAQRYRAAIADIAQGKRYVTDKLPPNYERLGLIQRLFPEALVIHTRRDPRDTCLSCFFQNFGNTHAYTTSLRALGEVYGIYRDLMAHWHTTLHMPILDVDYEAIVAAPEENVRRLLDFCNLSWNDDCLNFHATKRYVNTASYDQVRQPLYDSSVGRWRHYERYLGELLEALPKDAD